MSTYYEILNIPSTATVSEIEAAYETQYNHWRRLVTHHDPEKASQANQMLLRLEKARATLADAAKREQYDASIGLLGPVGGLADPHAVPQTATRTPPSPGSRVATAESQPVAAPQSLSSPVQQTDAWVCPKCHKSNPLGTPHCNQCGQRLGRRCPKCGMLTEDCFPFCSTCGVNMDELVQEQQAQVRRDVEKSLSQISQFISQAQGTRSQSRLSHIAKQIVSLGEQAAKMAKKHLPDHEAKIIRERLMVLMEQAEKSVVKKSKRWLFL